MCLQLRLRLVVDLHPVEVLQEVAAVAFVQAVPGLVALEFEEVDREDVGAPVFDAGDAGQFLKVVGDGEVLKLFEFEVDGFHHRQDPAFLAHEGQDLVEVCDVVVVGGIDLVDFVIHFFPVAGEDGFAFEEVLDVEGAAGLQHFPCAVEGCFFIVGVPEGFQEVDDVVLFRGEQGRELVVVAVVDADFVCESFFGDVVLGFIVLDPGDGDGINFHAGMLCKPGGRAGHPATRVQDFHAGFQVHGFDLVVEELADIRGPECLDDFAIDFEKVVVVLVVEGADGFSFLAGGGWIGGCCCACACLRTCCAGGGAGCSGWRALRI